MPDVPPTPVATVSPPAPEAKAPPWFVVPVLLLIVWAVVMSVLQHRSLWHALATLYGLFLLFAVALLLVAPRVLQGEGDARGNANLFRVVIAGLLLVAGWVLLVGSHGWWWDILAAYVVAGVAVALVRSRVGAFKAPRARMTAEFIPALLLVVGAAAWLGMSLMDRWFHATPVRHDAARFESFAPPPRPVAVALSGGGYRAVLYHAGLLHALEQLGLRPTHISAVSGGSIIAAFYTRGGAPRDLLQAVAGRRFNLRRDLADFRNAPRLAFPMTLPLFDTVLFPWWSFSRLDVQANLLDDLLLGGETLRALYGGGTPAAPRTGRPRLMLNATDVNYGLGFGVTADGFLVTSAARAAWIAPAFPSAFEGGRLARLAAISGAFPGAFPATNVEFDAEGHPLKGVQLSLVDGGVLDNSGVRDLLVLNRLANGRSEFCGDEKSQRVARVREAAAHRVVERAAAGTRPDPSQWRLDAIIASDAGKPFRPPTEPITALEAEVDGVDRAVSLAGLHAAVPVDGPCAGDPAPIWLYPEALADVDGKRTRPPSDTTIERIAASIPRALFDAERRRSPNSRPIAWVRNLAGRPQPKLLTDLCACETVESPLDVRSLARDERAYLVDQIRDDIAQGVRLFEGTSTLKDTFPERDAYALFRLGVYAVFEQSGRIRALVEPR